MANSTTMKYGAYSFQPVPLVTISKAFNKTEDSIKLSTTRVIRLEGTLTPLPNGITGYVNVDALQDDLDSAFSSDGKRFEVKCGVNVLIEAYPRVNSLEFTPSNNNWVQTSSFSIELEYEDEETGVPPYISTASDTWNVEFIEDNKKYSLDLSTIAPQHQDGSTYYNTDSNPTELRITHSVSAKGLPHYSAPSSGQTGILNRVAWKEAREYVITKLGFDSSVVSQSGVLNLDDSLFSAYDHFRTTETNELAGTYSVSESWVVIDLNVASGMPSGRATEDFTVDVRTSLTDAITSVSIQGQIKGLETRVYGTNPGDFVITENAFESAETYWNEVQNRLLSRVQYASQSDASRTINALPLSKSWSENPAKGIISYSYEYDDRPCNFLTGAISESITVIDNHHTDVFAQIPVLGRVQGPVLQSIGTVTPTTREVSIEAIMEPPTGCSTIADFNANKPTTEVDALLCLFETELTTGYNQVFKTTDSESWSQKTGAYSRQVAWIYQSCTDSGNTSLC